MKSNKPNPNDEDREFHKTLGKLFLRFLNLAEIIVIILAAGTVATLVYGWLLPNVDKNIAVAVSGAFAGATGAIVHGVLGAYRAALANKDRDEK